MDEFKSQVLEVCNANIAAFNKVERIRALCEGKPAAQPAPPAAPEGGDANPNANLATSSGLFGGGDA